jgi:hypothetical protein
MVFELGMLQTEMRGLVKTCQISEYVIRQSVIVIGP